MEKTMVEMKVEEEIKPLKELCDKLVTIAKSELERGVENVDTHEMGEVIDMIKDLSEAKKDVVKACYHKQIMAAMEESEYGEDYDEEGPIERKYYRGQPRDSRGRYMSRRGYDSKMPMDYRMSIDDYRNYSPEYMRDMDRKNGKMYYTESNSSMSRGMSNMRDSREGKSGMSRKNYMESKEMHKQNTLEDKQAKMQELEKYMRELSDDVTEMIADATPEERNMLKAKMQTLVQKLN